MKRVHLKRPEIGLDTDDKRVSRVPAAPRPRSCTAPSGREERPVLLPAVPCTTDIQLLNCAGSAYDANFAPFGGARQAGLSAGASGTAVHPASLTTVIAMDPLIKSNCLLPWLSNKDDMDGAILCMSPGLHKAVLHFPGAAALLGAISHV
jgi:hypothetical protein